MPNGHHRAASMVKLTYADDRIVKDGACLMPMENVMLTQCDVPVLVRGDDKWYSSPYGSNDALQPNADEYGEIEMAKS